MAVELDILHGRRKAHTVHCNMSVLIIVYMYPKFPVHQHATGPAVNILSTLQ